MLACKHIVIMSGVRIWRSEAAFNWEKDIVSFVQATATLLAFAGLLKFIYFYISHRKSFVFPASVNALLVCAILLSANSAFAAPDLLGGTATAEPGQEVFIPVDFVADGSVVALQYDLAFNSNLLSITNVSSGSALVDHVFDWQLVAPGKLRVVITTATLAPLNSGRLATIRFKIDDAALEGTEALILQQLVLAESTALAVPPTDVQNGSITILAPGALEDAVAVPATTAPALVLMIFLLGLAGYVYIKRGTRGITLSIVLGLTLFSSTIVRSSLFPGDANGDGNVDVADIPVIVTQILEITIAVGDPDCNQDLMVDVLDTICVAQPAAENQPPVLAAIADQSALVDESFAIMAVATDPDVGDILTYSLDVFPVGMNINSSSGQISWVPDVAQLGANSVTVRATDPDGLFDTEPFQVNVIQIGVNRAPDLIPPGNRVIQTDILFTTPLFATDPDVGDVLTFELSSAPAGMGIDPTSGILSWTPLADDFGINPVTATVMDAGGLMDTESFSIEVIQPIVTREVNTPPQLTVPANQTIVFGNLLDLLAMATGADVGDTLTFALVNAPTGMVIDAVTGAITWTPLEAQVGMHDVAVKVTDAANAAAFGSFIVTVRDVNKAPQAADDIYQTRARETLTINAPGVLLNDIDLDDDILATSLVDAPAKGTAALQSDGSFTYLYVPPTPDPVNIELEAHCSSGLDFLGSTGPYGQVAVGDVDNDGRVEVVGMASARIFVMDGATCELEYLMSTAEVNNLGLFPDNTAHIGLVDLDGDQDLEIVVATGFTSTAPFSFGQDVHGHLIAYHHDGTLVWNRAVEPGEDARFGNITPLIRNPAHPTAPIGDWRSSGPSFADLDQDGKPEILMGFNHDDQTAASSAVVISGVVAFNGEDGSLQWVYFGEQTFNPKSVLAHIADLDLDGIPEVIYQSYVLDNNGNRKFAFQLDDLALGTIPKSVVSAIANFDNDAYPEVLIRHGKDFYLFEHGGTRKWKQPFSATDFFEDDELTVGDFDGDGKMEFTHRMTEGSNLHFGAFARYQVVYKNDGTVLWSHETSPEYYSNQFERPQAVTAYDVNKDGADDIVADLRIDALTDDPALGVGDAVLMAFDGKDGTELFRARSYQDSSSSVFPVIADLDNDGEAEILLSGQPPLNSLATETRFHIYQGKSTSPLPPAPPIHSQWSFNPAYVNLDGSIPANPVPHWLIPGLNGFHKVPTVANVHDRSTITDSFTYKANDGSLDSNVATVTLEILPAGNAPVFLSQPDTLTTVGFEYKYSPIVVDADPGDIVSFSLTAAPAGMTIDASNGRVRWLPDTTGAYSVAILASDTIGFATLQSYILLVGEPVEVPDVVGQPEATAEGTLTTANLVVGRKQTATHPTVPVGSVSSQTPIAGSVIEFGGAVDLILSLGPAPEDIDDDNDGFTENQGDCNDDDDTIKPGVADPEGDGIDQDCDGIDGNLVLSEILVLPADSTVLTSQSVSLKAIGIFEDGSSQNLTGIASWSAGPVFSSPAPGIFNVTATRDAIVGSATVNVSARTPSDGVPPVAEITSPDNDATVTEPVDIIGTASDGNFLKYELAYAVAGGTQYTQIVTSTTPVTGGVLGQFDPTMLLNDLYVLRLTVFDTGGNQLISEVVLQVEGAFKAGNFSLAYTDFNIDLSGIPLTINRVYDSRDKIQGAFGYGWKLDIQSFRLNVSDELSEGWRVIRSGLSYGLVEDGIHKVSVTLPGGKVEAFDLVVKPYVSPIIPFPSGSLTASWQPRSGTVGSLISLGNNHLSVLGAQPGEISLVDDLSVAPFSPEKFEYRHPLGAVVLLDRNSGVESIQDSNGNSITISDTGIAHSSGTEIIFDKDDQGRITRITDPGGKTHDYQYDGNGDLRKHTDQMGAVTEFSYQYDHYLIKVVDPIMRPVTRQEFDDSGRLIAIIDALGNRSELAVDIPGRSSVVQDRTGGVTVFTYDDRGNAVNKTDPAGNIWSYSYDDLDRQLSETNPLGETTSYSYDTLGNVLSMTDGLGNQTTFERDAAGRMTKAIDPTGVIQEYKYDSRGNKLAGIDGLGHSEVWSYNSRGEATGYQDKAGRSWNMSRDSSGRLLETVTPFGQVNGIDYNASGEIIRSSYLVNRSSGSEELEIDLARNPRGQITELTAPMLPAPAVTDYNLAGEISGGTDPEGNSIGFERDITSRIMRRTDSSGPPMLFSYDAAGRDIETVLANGSTIERQRDVRGLNTATTMSDYGTSVSTFDALGREVGLTEPGLGNRTNTFDAAGRNTRTSLPDGTFVGSEYDAAGRTTRQVDPLGNESTYQYDQRGMLVSMTAADGKTYERSWTEDAKLQTRRDELGVLWTYSYDAAGNVATATDPSGNTAGFVSNLFGKVSEVRSPAGRIIRYGYDDVGNLTEVIQPDGSYSHCSFDSLGRQTQCTDNLGAQTTYSYDDITAESEILRPEGLTKRVVDDLGRLVQLTNPRGDFTLDRDTLGRIRSYVNPLSERVDTVFHANGQADTTATHSGGFTKYVYDERGMKESVDQDGHLFLVDRDSGGRPVAINFENGASVHRVYDAAGRIMAVEYQSASAIPLVEYGYGYDAWGRLNSSSESSGSSMAYNYDLSGRLTGAQTTSGDPSQDVDYQYDADGNVVSRDQNGSLQSYTVNESDFLLTDQESTFTWDASGNLRSRSRLGTLEEYSWDSQNRLIEYSRGGNNPVEIAYEYAFDGLLESRRSGSVVETFTWERNAPMPLLIEIHSSIDSAPTRYIYDDLFPIAETTPSGDVIHHLRDRQGSLRARINTDGIIVESLDYNAWGVPVQGLPSPVGYTGGYHDAESGMIFLRSRWYAPDIERFVSRDSAPAIPTDHRTINRYTYGLDDPLNRIDLSGQIPSFANVVVSLAIANIIGVVGYSAYRDGLSRVFSSIGGATEVWGYFLDQIDAKFASVSIFKEERTGAGLGLVFFPSASFNARNLSVDGGLEFLKFKSDAAAYIWFGSRIGTGTDTLITLGAPSLSFGSAISHTPTPGDYEGPFITTSFSFGLFAANLGSVTTKAFGAVGVSVGTGVGGSIFWSPVVTYTDKGDGKEYRSHGVRGGPLAGKGASFGLGFSTYIKIRSKSTINSPGLF